MLAEDLKPNRLEASKAVASRFISGRPDDNIGLVLFSAESFTQCPLTTDHRVVLNLLSQVKSGIIEDGTAIGLGLANAVNRIKDAPAKSKVIILLTDGSNNRGDIDPITAAELAKEYGIRVYTIGVGTRGKAPYPFQTAYGIQYQNIDVVIDEEPLKKIAGITGGEYYRATDNRSLSQIYAQIDQLEKTRFHVKEVSQKTKNIDVWSVSFYFTGHRADTASYCIETFAITKRIRTMFRFSNPAYLYLLVVVPLLLVLLWFNQKAKRKQFKVFGDPALLGQLTPDVSVRRAVIKVILQLVALTTCIFMLAGPQFGSKIDKSTRKGAEIMIALDLSNSMMAEDIKPCRLDKSKQIISKLVDQLQNDKLGLVVFAGHAFTQIPITSDFVSAKLFLSSLTPDLIQRQGTAIGSAIDLCVNSFGPKGDAERAIIVITDGENFEDDAVASAKRAAEQGIKVHVVGMGDVNGAPIPTKPGTNDFRKDKEGNVIITKLNEKVCQEIAAAGKGLYVHSDNSSAALRVLSKELDNMKKANLNSTVYSEYDEQFQALAWIVLFFLLLDSVILERKNPLFKNIKLI
jgi:Ca-activated chloride channel family protein